MIFDSNGFPRDAGASDYMDSCRLAGMMALIHHPQAPQMLNYTLVETVGYSGVRHPTESPSNNPKNFTRDQLVLLAAGLAAQGRQDIAKELLVAAHWRNSMAQNSEYDIPGSTKKAPNGPDWLSPSVMNHLKLCAGEKPTLLGKSWLLMDILYSAYVAPMAEPNQLIALCIVAGPFYVKLLKKLNTKIKDAVMKYWDSWRGEKIFGAMIVAKLDQYK